MNCAAPSPLYRLLLLLLYPLWWLHALKHGFDHGLLRYPWLRLGGFVSAVEPQVWVHGASVGEIRAAVPLVDALVDDGHRVLVTSFTATGYQAARQAFGERVAVGVIPIDLPWHCRAFFRLHPIRCGLILETELWPELLFQARRHAVRLVQLNARLSRKSLDRGAFGRSLLAGAQSCFDALLTRNAGDREALLALGADPQRVVIVGNLKTRGAAIAQPSRLIDRDYLLLASSHAGEERRLLETWPDNLGDQLLVLAPRHPSRGGELQALLADLGLAFAVRSRGDPVSADTCVYLADTLGELAALMAHARVVVMGGSFDGTGGHNLVEPACLGCAIITGPNDANVRDDIEMLGNGDGILQVTDIEACWQTIGELLADPERAHGLGETARARLAAQPDMVSRYLEQIRPYL